MRTRTRSVLLVTTLSLAAFALQAGTADAAKRNSARRDAMIEQCMAKAHAETPFYNPTNGGYRRADIYKNCMIAAGMRP